MSIYYKSIFDLLSEEDLKKLSKKCFDIYVGGNYNRFIKKYSIDDYKITKPVFEDLYDYYYTKFANEEEKQLFYEARIENYIKMDNRNKENFELYKNTFYSFLKEENFKLKEQQLSEKYEVTTRQIQIYVKNYYIRFATPQEQELYELKADQNKINRQNHQTVLTTQNMQEEYQEAFIISINNKFNQTILESVAANKGITLSQFKTYAAKYYAQFATEKEQALFEKVKKENFSLKEVIQTPKIDEVKQEQQAKEEKLSEAIKMVNKFLDSKIKSINQFCIENKIEENILKENIEIIKIKKKDIYDEYKKQQEEVIKEKEKTVIAEAKKVVLYLKTGVIEDNGRKRKLNLLDYYLITNHNPNQLQTAVYEKISPKDYHLIRRFALSYQYQNNLPIERVMAGKHIINKDGQPYEITKREKEEVINYLNDNKVPILERTYHLALKKHIKGELYKKELKELKKTL